MSGFDMSAISIIEPGHEQYEQLDVPEQTKSRYRSTLFYNEVIQAYNDSPVGAILLVPLPEKIRFSNLRNVFAGRGLEGDDVVISRQNSGPDGKLLPLGSRPAKVKKCSEKKGRIVDIIGPLGED